MGGYIQWVLQSFNDLYIVLKGNLNHCESGEKDVDEAFNVDTSLTSHSASGAGGTRAGLFRTPISGGVQSATSAHGLPRPSLAVRNLMEQVMTFFCSSSIPFSFNRWIISFHPNKINEVVAYYFVTY